MNIFKRFTMEWWQAGIFKASVVSLGVAIGANWPEIFAPYTLWLLVIAAMLGIYLALIWWKQ